MRHADPDSVVFQVLLGRMRGDLHSTDSIDCQVVRRVIREAIALFQASPAILRLTGSFVVVGDIHGNLDDLIRIFERHGYPPDQRYLFLGDYIDRGSYSIEVLLLIYALFVKYPSHISLIRGNHETRVSSKAHGFSDLCLLNLSKTELRLFLKSFAQMPIAATLNNRIMCVHGGISPSISTLAELEAETVRPLVSVSSSSVVDILWSDPCARVLGFKPNTRGTGFFFGSEPLEDFLDDNGFDCLIRAHEWFDAGWNWPFGQQGRCLTVFSSSDYCGKGNKGAVALVSEDCRIETVEFEPMVATRLRRVLLPVWILAEGTPAMEPVLPEVPDVCIDGHTEAEIGLACPDFDKDFTW
jgi:protein phosphatase